MHLSRYLGGAVLSLSLLLAACGGAQPNLPEAPAAEVAQPEGVETEEVTGPEPTPVESPPTEEADLVEEMPAEADPTMEEATVEAQAMEVEEVTGTVEMAEAEPESEPALTGTGEAVGPEESSAEEEMLAEEVAAAPPGPTEEQQQLLNSLTVKGMPPELHNEVWLNSEPLKLADLRGQVVIVEFWTFG